MKFNKIIYFHTNLWKCLFYLKSIAPAEVKTLSIYRGIIPFVFIQASVLSLVVYQPEIALWLPRQVYD